MYSNSFVQSFFKENSIKLCVNDLTTLKLLPMALSLPVVHMYVPLTPNFTLKIILLDALHLKVFKPMH